LNGVETSSPRTGRWSRLRIPGGRDAGLLLVARVVMSGQRAFVGVVVPIYLARRGFSAAQLGLLFSVVAMTAAVMSTAIGIGADHLGARRFLIWVPLLTAGSAVVFALSDQTAAMYIAAAVGSFGRGSGAGGGQVGPYQPAEQSLLAGLVDDERRPALFGIVASASAAGGLLGSLLAITPLSSPHAGPIAYRPAFIAAAVLGVLTAALAIPVRVGRAPGPRASTSASAPASERRRRRRRLSAPSRLLVRRLWATNSVNGAAVGLFAPFITYWLYRRYGASASEIGVLYTVGNVLTIATNQLAGPVARRGGTVRSVVVLRTVQALLLTVLALMPSFALAGFVYVLRLVFQRLSVSLRSSFVMTSAPAEERARVAAFAQLPTQGISALAPTLSGYLFEEVSLALPFEIAGVLQLINAGLFHVFFGRTGRASEAGPEPASGGAGPEPAEARSA
jgi:MFS family permease